MSNDTPTVAPLYTDEQLKQIGFLIATDYFMQKPPKEHPLTKLIMNAMIAQRNDYERTLAELRAEVARLEGERRWQPVDFIRLDDGLEIHVDHIAMTIGKGDTALATHAWPDDGNTYAVCRLTPAKGADDADT